MYAVPKPSEMFSDATTPTEVADRFEAYKSTLADVYARSARGDLAFERGVGIVKRSAGAADAIDTIEKSLSPEQLAGVQAALDQVKALAGPDLAKDWTTTNPLANGLVPYDLQPVLQMLVPRNLTLRNSIGRVSGVGSAREFRQITGVSNSGTGGVADVPTFFSSSGASTAFGGLNFRRPGKISYAAVRKTVGYVEQGVSDQVDFRAQFEGTGFTDLRQVSHTASMWAHLIGEEKNLLKARGSGTGYAGAVAAPTISLAAASGGSLAAGTLYVKVTAVAGFGESVVAAANVAVTASQKVTVTITSEPTGALSYNVYASETSGAETYQFNVVGKTSFDITSVTGGGAAAPTSDSSANANAYDGFVTVLTDPAQSGYVRRVNAALSTASPGTEWQEAFQSLYGSVLAEPDEVLMTAAIRVELSDAIKNNGTGQGGGYRLSIDQNEVGGVRLGSVVTGIQNEPTGKFVDMKVHPYLPAGVSLIRSKTLPIPDSGVSETSAVVNVQDLLVLEWPVIQMTYDLSTYQFGTLVHYAPAWSGALVGIQ